MKACTALAGLTLALGFFTQVHAATCFVDGPDGLFDPDATVTDSTKCGIGPNDNDTAALLDAATGDKGWFLISRDNAGGSDGAFLQSTGLNPAGSSGSWAFNDLGYTSYALVIKDGGVDGPDGDNKPDSSWAWFIVDTSAGCLAASALDDYTYCGLWEMYGDASKKSDGRKNISHLTLYGRNFVPPDECKEGSTDPDCEPPTDVPEPGSLALIGIALAGLAAVSRRRRLK